MIVLLVVLSTFWVSAAGSCGISPLLDKRGRIVFGEFAEPGSWPWQIEDEVRFNPEGNWRHNCGASLISAEWAVTAAHCYSLNSQNEHRLILGQHNRGERTGDEQIIPYTFDDLIVHENYDPSDLWANDIALIRIPQPVDMSVPEVGTICLPSTNNFVGKECWASGWGLDENLRNPDVLKQTDMVVLPEDECRAVFGDSIREIHVCAQDGDLAAATCTGDSGGPLQCVEDGVFELVGALSFGLFLCPRDSPSAFANVPEFLDWIEANTGVTRENQV